MDLYLYNHKTINTWISEFRQVLITIYHFTRKIKNSVADKVRLGFIFTYNLTWKIIISKRQFLIFFSRQSIFYILDFVLLKQNFLLYVFLSIIFYNFNCTYPCFRVKITPFKFIFCHRSHVCLVGTARWPIINGLQKL